MKTDLVILFTIFLAVFVVFRQSFTTFFAQDDFILIAHFSQNNLFSDFINLFKVEVTHWRPLHNLYFLVAGNLFGKNFVLYHLITFLIHITVSFLIYKITKIILEDKSASFIAAFIYAIHPSHFITLFWNSGSATTIGFLLLLISFYLYLKNKRKASLGFYIASILASEAMTAGIVIFGLFDHIFKKRIHKKFYLTIIGISSIFLLLKLTFLKPAGLTEFYDFSLSAKVIDTIIYYLTRIAGFGETSSDVFASIILTVWLILLGFFVLKRIILRIDLKSTLFPFSLIAAGLLPFVLLPNHLSPHYTNISIFGFALLVAVVVKSFSLKKRLLYTFLFFIISTQIVNKTYNNNWVINRSHIAKEYIVSIEKAQISSESTIIFNDNNISSSQEAYFSLGKGDAIKFWFRDKSYKTCFTWIENCENVQ